MKNKTMVYITDVGLHCIFFFSFLFFTVQSTGFAAPASVPACKGATPPPWDCADCTASACTGQRYRDVIKLNAGGQGGGVAPLHAGSEAGEAKPVL